ncbi:MAG: NAD-dependent epimerase/dehydratase family protein [Anaerolineales bacterium]
MKICVIGGTGNISSAFIQLLFEDGHDVTCYNRGISGSMLPAVNLIKGDRSNRIEFEQVIQAQKFDAAIDMICFNKEDAASSIRAFRGVQQFVFTSTVCVYGLQYDWLPVTEDHPLRPVTAYGKEKAEAEKVFLEAFYKDNFPVTIIRPSTTFGPIQGAIRQIGWDYTWIDRIRKGKPIVVCGDGLALHQFLHVDDAALCFTNVIGRENCVGQVYNMTKRGFTSWRDYHLTAMEVIGRQVDLVGVPLDILESWNIPGFDLCKEIFAYNVIYNSEKLFRDVPEFSPKISLNEALADTISDMDRTGRITDSDAITWEDRLIESIQQIKR